MIPGFTSTASKRPGALFGGEEGVPTRMVRASGCRVWDDSGREYLDTIMALGSVALGYGHPRVTEAAISAARKGVIGPLPPVLEGEVAERLNDLIPLAEGTRFFQTGAEAMAAAVRIGRVHTGRERVIRCGYHGWLDWCQTAAGVPAAVGSLAWEVPFNDVEALRLAVEQFEPLAAIVVEPVVDGQPSAEWLAALTEACKATSAVLVFDEIKTAFRLQAGGAAERFGVEPDLMVVGKALGNGFPIAAVCGNEELMRAATATWISSTYATEFVSLAAAGAVLDTFADSETVERIGAAGRRLWRGLEGLARRYPRVVSAVRGIHEMCYLDCHTEEQSALLARRAAARGLLFKRNAYNFVSLAHTDEVLTTVLERVEAALNDVDGAC